VKCFRQIVAEHNPGSLFPNTIQFHDIYSPSLGLLSLCHYPPARYNHNMISLIQVPPGKRVRLASFEGMLLPRLKRYGLHVGDELLVVRTAPLGGPVLIEVNDREIAVGSVLAEKILVELVCESR
jgi:ferrous iron transport protein A